MARGSKPRKARSHPIKVVEYPNLPPIRIQRREVWRLRNGRLAKPHAKGAKKTTFLAQVGPTGRVLDVLEVMTKKSVIKTSLPGAVEANAGLINRALGQTNAFTRGAKGARRVNIRVDYILPNGKHQSFKLQHDTVDRYGKPWKNVQINHLTTGSIVAGLRARGLRTQYQIGVVNWAKVKDIFRKSTSGRKINVTGMGPVSRRAEVTGLRIALHYEK